MKTTNRARPFDIAGELDGSISTFLILTWIMPDKRQRLEFENDMLISPSVPATIIQGLCSELTRILFTWAGLAFPLILLRPWSLLYCHFMWSISSMKEWASQVSLLR